MRRLVDLHQSTTPSKSSPSLLSLEAAILSASQVPQDVPQIEVVDYSTSTDSDQKVKSDTGSITQQNESLNKEYALLYFTFTY